MSREIPPTDAGRPRARPVEAFPVAVEGERRVALRDPAGYSDQVMIVSPETLFVISCLDGTRTLRDVQEACFRRFLEIVPMESLRALVDSLDAALLLDSAAFRRRREEIEKAFLASPVRPAAHVGGAYDRDPAALRDRLSRLLDEAAAGAPPLPEGPLAGLIAPHIDMHRGGAGYGAAYRAAAALSRAETFVVLGTVHAAPPEPYTATRKAYATPLGAVESDAAFLDRLEALYGARLFANEAAHRSEHSIEFQAVWIRFLAGERTVRIAPILCSSFHEAVAAGRDPSADARVADFAAALREVLAERPGAAVIAAADLAHLGPRFGDREPVGDRTASWCAARDRAILERAAAGDAAGFFAPIAEETDRRRICGVSAVWTLLEVLPPGARGTLLHYGQALDEERTTLVSFASVAFTSQS